MARCGCSSALCTCRISGAGGLVSVSGSGSATDEYVVTVSPTVVQVANSSTVTMTITGTGTSTSPYVITATSSSIGPNKSSAGAGNAAGLTTGNPVTTHVNYPAPSPGFTVAPAVTLTAVAANPQNFDVGVNNITTTGFDFIVTRRAGSSTGLTVQWIAVGK